jgi:predicted permease
MREWLLRLFDWFRRGRLQRDLEDELRFHRHMLERDASAGKDASWIARRRLGNRTRILEDARERWSLPSLDTFQQDVRYALRALRRSPAFTVTVIATLGLGIGANAAMFDVVDRLMFRPHGHLRDPESVHRLYFQNSFRGTLVTTTSTDYRRYLELQRGTTAFSQFAAFSERVLSVGEGASQRERRVGVVSASFFQFFDATPALGRFFTPEEDRTPRGADVAVLSHAFWRSAFGGRDVRGRLLTVGNVRASIVGVAPPGFNGVHDADPPAVYLPITTFAANEPTQDAKTYFARYDWSWLNVMGRRRPGVSLAQANTDATTAFRRTWATQQAEEPLMPSLESARPQVVVSSLRLGAGPDPAPEARTALWVAGVAIIVLLIAMANIANLFLTRALQRQRETTVRLALGVSRGRLVRHSLTESFALALAGGTLAVVVAQWGGAAIRTLLVSSPSVPIHVYSDGRTLGATLVFVTVAAVVVGLVPVLLAVHGELATALRGGVRGGTSQRGSLRGSLVVLQGALSVALLVGAGLFVRSLRAVETMRLGYDVDPVLMVNRIVRGDALTDGAHRALRDVLLSTAQSLPGVESAAWVSSAPFVSTSITQLFVAGIDSVQRLGQFTYQATTPDYFRVMGTRILRGRPLGAEDRSGSPEVAVVSTSMARVLWPGEDALGKCFRMRADTAPCVTVVGIAEDMVQRDLTAGERYHYYVPIDQFRRTNGRGLLIRVRGDPARESPRLGQELQRVMTGQSYLTLQPLRDVVHREQRSWRLGATMFTAFGVLALVVAAVGLYGVIGYNVAQRAHEMGVRVALGAQRKDLLWLVVGQSVRFTLAGIALGALASWGASTWMQPLLYQQSARDPLVYVGVGLLMFVVALVASASPAARAAGADPNRALRAE